MPPEAFDSALGASYVLDERIGRGATGEVWRGTDRRTGETVAAKVLHREHLEDDTLVERFVRERSILVGLRHPNVVAVRDLVVEGERLAIVMEFVGGGSLRDTLRERGPLRPAVAFRVVGAVLDGLAAAHDRHVLHRDLKPDNVLLASAWQYLGPGAVKLSDFGIAEIVADGTRSSSGLIGTPEYMAPEQLVTGAGDLPADVYGVGILLYELLGGRTPFAGPGTGYAVAHRHVTSEAPRLPVPDPVWDVIAGHAGEGPGAPADRPRRSGPAAPARAGGQRPGGDPGAGDARRLPVRRWPGDRAARADRPHGRCSCRRGARTAAARTAAREAEPLPELGTPSQETMLRPMPVLPAETAPRPSSTAPSSTGWRLRDRRSIALDRRGRRARRARRLLDRPRGRVRAPRRRRPRPRSRRSSRAPYAIPASASAAPSPGRPPARPRG